jgi:hypothetical protein
MKPSPSYLSFLIRMWCESIAEEPGSVQDWQGEIEHIQSGRQWQFRTIEELVQFLRDPALNVQDQGEEK